MGSVGTRCHRKYWGISDKKNVSSDTEGLERAANVSISRANLNPLSPIWIDALSNTPQLGARKWTPANEITVKPDWSCQVYFPIKLTMIQLGLCMCVYVTATQCFPVYSTAGPVGGLTRGRACGLPLQRLWFIYQPSLICTSWGFAALSEPPQARLNPRGRWALRQQGCIAVNHHSSKQIS